MMAYYYIYNNSQMESFVKEHFPEYYESYSSINKEYNVAKTDFFRYMVVYHYGGVYIDIKSGFKVPLREIWSHIHTWCVVETFLII